MTVREVIDAIKALAPDERAEVIRFVSAITEETKVEFEEDAAVDGAAEEIFEHHAELFKKLADDGTCLTGSLGEAVSVAPVPEGGKVFAKQMETAESVIRRYSNTLRDLAK